MKPRVLLVSIETVPLTRPGDLMTGTALVTSAHRAEGDVPVLLLDTERFQSSRRNQGARTVASTSDTPPPTRPGSPS